MPLLIICNLSLYRFAESVIPYLVDYGFDGLDLDWEFPAWGRFRSKPEQKHNFTLTLQALRETFDNYTEKRVLPKYLLTTAVASTIPLILGCYEIPEMSKYVDFINLMTYDIHGFGKTTPFTGHNSPMYSGQSLLDKTIFYYYNMVNIDFIYELWVEHGMKKSQIRVGIPTYAHTFHLLSEKSHGLYSLATGYNTTLGDEISRALICKLLNDTSFKQVWDKDCAVPYAYSGTTWISYENKQSVYMKVKWILENKYGGIMTYSLNVDDYVGQQCGEKWPMHRNIFNAAKKYSPIQ
ncbi:hypothetical protein LOTGIDRAFT_131946 [Lottia gigantea]|uniref:GH18 domain-containing protein n=1 Tax=Lottia gigantea TaxID=225164 RepID=V3ZQ10_LOTGI|nr:hypothetical protein LOTGIDRAFT_131946 [Lottia gigantea]ESO84590.1 hypothetical protein LOTGIDRAFT_131946 [Lottia gigantea]